MTLRACPIRAVCRSRTCTSKARATSPAKGRPIAVPATGRAAAHQPEFGSSKRDVACPSRAGDRGVEPRVAVLETSFSGVTPSVRGTRDMPRDQQRDQRHTAYPLPAERRVVGLSSAHISSILARYASKRGSPSSSSVEDHPDGVSGYKEYLLDPAQVCTSRSGGVDLAHSMVFVQWVPTVNEIEVDQGCPNHRGRPSVENGWCVSLYRSARTVCAAISRMFLAEKLPPTLIT